MNIKIALSIFDHRIAPVFDVASQVLLVDIKSSGVYEESLAAMPRESADAKVLKLVELEVKTLICGAISKPMLVLAQSHGIQVFDFVAGEAHQVLQAFKDKCLHEDEFKMPGCRRQKRNRKGRGGPGCQKQSWFRDSRVQRPE